MPGDIYVKNKSTFAVTYGRAEIRNVLYRNLLTGLLISLGIHLAVISSYYLQQYLNSSEQEAPFVHVRLMKYSELGPPPSITTTEQIPAVGVTVAAPKPIIGIPVPVPDVEISPEQTISTQQELSQVQSPAAVQQSSSGDLVVKQDIQIEEEPAPDAFVPVEKEPIPVKQVKPLYPEIARRTGIEGVVWVKVLVDKEGKVKKAIIMKSDVELFNDAAIEAAMQFVFTPAVMNHGPVSVWVAIPFKFRLNKQST